MVSSALNYANRLKKNKNKGPLGQIELFDTSLQVSKKTNRLFELMRDSYNTLVHTGAGVSTGSGIPDFRGPTGIWTLMDSRTCNNTQQSNDLDYNIDNNNNVKKPKRRKMTDANCIPTRDCSSTNYSNQANMVKRENDMDTTNITTSKSDSNSSSTDKTSTTSSNTKDNDGNSNKDSNSTNTSSNTTSTGNQDNDHETMVKEEYNENKDGDETTEKDEYVLYGNNRKKAVEFILALPSETHLCLLEMLNKGIVKFIITQNIDGLHSLSGIPFDKLSELHGNVFVQRCLWCARRFQRSYVAPTISFQPTGDLCGICSFPPFNLLTDVVLDWFDCYEEHFEENSMRKAERADLHLVLGSSLHIEPACHYASNDYYRNIDSPLVIVNYQSTKLDPESDIIIHEDVNKICNILLKKFNLTIPTFIRKSYLIILKYQSKDNNCILLIKLSCILEVELINKFSTSKNSSKSNLSSDNDVKLECINKLQGIYRFTFSRNFKLRLKLFYNTQLEFEVPYERIVSFKGEIWELDLCATNGSKVKLTSKTFVNKCCNFENEFHSTISSNRDSNSSSTNKTSTTTKDNDGDSNKDNSTTTSSNTTSTGNQDNSSKIYEHLIENESINTDGLIHINRMIISYNSHLILNTPFRLVGYLDLINKKSEEYQEFKLSNSLIILSYLWASNFIQNSNINYHDPKEVKNYLRESKMFNDLIFGYSYNKDDYTYDFPDDKSEKKRRKHKSKRNKDEFRKVKVEDALEGYYDQYLSKTYTTHPSGSGSTKNIDNSSNIDSNSSSTNKTSTTSSNSSSDNMSNTSSDSYYNRDNNLFEYSDADNNRDSSSNLNNDSDINENNDTDSNSSSTSNTTNSNTSNNNSKENKDNYNRNNSKEVKKERRPSRNNKYKNEDNDELDRSSSFDSDSEIKIKRKSERSERGGRVTNSTTKRKDEIWTEISESNKFAELILNKSLKYNLIRIKYSKVTPILQRLNLERYLTTIQSSLPLKLFISKNVKLGYLVRDVPYELVESNKVGNYKNYHRLFRYYDLPNILNSIDEIRNDKDNILKEILIDKELYRNIGANLYELMVYNVVKRSYDLLDVGDYIIIKLFYKQLPLWILKYLSDLFECR